MKKIYLLVTTVLLLHQVLFAQSIPVGNGNTGNTGTTYPCPLQDYYEGSRAQYLYPASELTAAGMTAGPITGIMFQVANVNGFAGTVEALKISIGHTAATTLSSSAWETGLTEVFGPADYVVVNGSNYFTFGVPFSWNGIDNIVIEICNGDNSNISSVTYTQNPTIPWTTGLSFNGSHTFRADNIGSGCGTATTTNAGTQTTRPNITFLTAGAPNMLYASAYEDGNFNGVKDANEPWFANAKFTTMKPGVDTISFISPSGRGVIGLDTGTYTTFVSALRYHTSIPASHTTTNTTSSHIDSIEFALQPIPGVRDASITITPLNVARPGFPLRLHITYGNRGTDTIVNAQITLYKSDLLVFDSSSAAPSSISGNIIRWTIADTMLPTQSGAIDVYCRVKAPPAVQAGDTIVNPASIITERADFNSKDDSTMCTQVARNSVDPNDKSENHGGRLNIDEVINGDYLTYTIRFQNTGNDTAFNVSIKDTLNSKLDWSTFEMLTACASYQVTISDAKINWTFNNINLVDSNHNELRSHGYLVYRVKANPSLVSVGDVITNRAAIYFDFNPPVLTNTENTTITGGLLPLKLLAFTAVKDGKANRLRWSTSNELNVDRFEIERSENGVAFDKMGSVKSKIESGGNNEYQYNDDVSRLASHASRIYYRLKMVDKDSRFTYSPIRVVNNNGGFYVSVYPNPAKDKLQVMIESDKKATLQVQVVGQDGKVLLSSAWEVTEGSCLKAINVSQLQSGNYYLKVGAASGEQNVVKFAVAGK